MIDSDIDFNKIVLNVKKSPYDNRDKIFCSNQKHNLNSKLDLREDLNPIRNQGNQGTCYAQSAACMKEWQEKKDYNLKEYLSPQFFYNNRFNYYDNNNENDEGMYGRDVMKILKDIGICYEITYPYGRIEEKKNIPDHVYEEAKKHKIKSYARINELDDLKESLFKNGPCLITFPVYNYNHEFWKPNNENETFKGGHAVTVVGYLENCFIIRNSWGTDWGEKGYSYYYFNDWGAHWEIWTTIDEETINDDKIPIEPEVNYLKNKIILIFKKMRDGIISLIQRYFD